MRKTLYLKFVLGYLIFGFFGFLVVATFVSSMTLEHLKREKADSLYKEATLIANTYASDLYSSNVSLEEVKKQLDALEENIYLSEFHASKGHAQKLTELDDQFHDILYEACSSKMLEHQLRDFHEYVRRMRKQNLSGSERGLEAVLEHKQIMEAICRKDADRAQELAALHMRNAYDNMIKNGLLDAYDEKERIDG